MGTHRQAPGAASHVAPAARPLRRLPPLRSLATVALALLVVGFAAAGIGAASHRFSAASPTIAVTPGSDLRLGGTVSFSTPGADPAARVTVDCFQSAAPIGLGLTWTEDGGYRVDEVSGGPGANLRLGGDRSAWRYLGGDATCTATLSAPAPGGTTPRPATTSFRAGD
jgi:hypothetical protein